MKLQLSAIPGMPWRTFRAICRSLPAASASTTHILGEIRTSVFRSAISRTGGGRNFQCIAALSPNLPPSQGLLSWSRSCCPIAILGPGSAPARSVSWHTRRAVLRETLKNAHPRNKADRIQYLANNSPKPQRRLVVYAESTPCSREADPQDPVCVKKPGSISPVARRRLGVMVLSALRHCAPMCRRDPRTSPCGPSPPADSPRLSGQH